MGGRGSSWSSSIRGAGGGEFIVVVEVFARWARLTGRLLAVTVTTKFSHPSIIVFALGFILWLSMGLLIGRSVGDDPDWEFSNFCTDSTPICPAGGNASALYYY